MTTNTGKHYDDEFKRSLVTLHQNGKTQTQLCKEYGVSQTALSKWYYLCIVMDLFSRKIIGWHISENHNVELTMTAFNKAFNKRKVDYGLLFPSDQGSEYTAFE